MAATTGRPLHTDQYLTEVVLNWRPEGFIGDQIAPIVPVPKQSDKILEYLQSDLFRIPNTRRSRGKPANVVEFQVGTVSFYCENYALAYDITLEDRVNQDPVFVRTREEGAARFLADLHRLDMEKRWANLVTSTSNVGSAVTVGSAWGTLSVADPLGDIWTVMDNIEDAMGLRPNHVLFSSLAWRLFKRNNTVIDKIHGTGLAGAGLSATIEEASRLLGARVLVSGAFENTAQEGIAQSLSRIFGDNVVVYYAPTEGPSTDRPSALYGFRWTDPAIPNFEVERHPYDAENKVQKLEIGYYQDELITDSDLVHLIQGVNSSQ